MIIHNHHISPYHKNNEQWSTPIHLNNSHQSPMKRATSLIVWWCSMRTLHSNDSTSTSRLFVHSFQEAVSQHSKMSTRFLLWKITIAQLQQMCFALMCVDSWKVWHLLYATADTVQGWQILLEKKHTREIWAFCSCASTKMLAISSLRTSACDML